MKRCCLFIILLAGGCAHAGSKPNAAGAGNTAITPKDFQFSNAVALVMLRTPSDTLDLGFKLKPPLVEKTLYFGEIAKEDSNAVPIIVARTGGKLLALQLENEWSANQWQRVSAGPGAGEIWGVLDHLEEDLGWDLVLAHSIDGGKNWKLTAIRKVCYYAEIDDLVMAKNGHGRITLLLKDDYTDTIKRGYYHYRTFDGGKTWAAPVHEADSTVPADEVPENEQPRQEQTVLYKR